MTTYYFAGGEDHDFTKLGSCGVNTSNTDARRTAYARCGLSVAYSNPGEGWVGTLSSSASAFWFSARAYSLASPSSGFELLAFNDASGVKRLVVDISSSGFRLAKYNAAGTLTSLATSAVSLAYTTLQKLDAYLNYTASGSFQLYLDGTLVLSYTGDMLTDSATSIAAFRLGSQNASTGTIWSEVICSDSDTRSMSLVTLAPSANGNTFNFTSGSVSSINETTLDDGTVITSNTVGQIAQFTVGSSGISGSAAIKAVYLSARASKGSTGPQTMKFNVRTGGADYAGTALALQNGSLARVAYTFSTNPASSSPWAASDLTAAGFNIGVTSNT